MNKEKIVGLRYTSHPLVDVGMNEGSMKYEAR